jgi:predicted TIM-barrel fold metal-dependent hydrolase
VPSLDALRPFLSEHWSNYTRENGFRQPQAIEYSYPGWNPVFGGADITVGSIQANVLEQSAAALVNCYYGLECIRNPYFAAALATAVNSWTAAEWLDREPRLLASIALPIGDVDHAVAEIRRVAASDRRFAEVYLPARAWDPYGNRRYWPIWEAAVEHDLAVGIHFGGVTGNPPTPVGPLAGYFDEYCAAGQLFQAHIVSMVCEGVFDRFPTLRVVLSESGVTWLPTLFWKIDTEWKSARREIPWVRRPPSEYIREHVRVTAQPLDIPPEAGQVLRDVLDQLGGIDMLMFSSDYPHRHAVDLEPLHAQLTPEERQRFDHDNAAEVFRIEHRLAQDHAASRPS